MICRLLKLLLDFTNKLQVQRIKSIIPIDLVGYNKVLIKQINELAYSGIRLSISSVQLIVQCLLPDAWRT